VNKAVFDTAKAVKDGKYAAGDNFFSATNDGIGYGTLDSVVPNDAKTAADQALADIKSGKIKPKDTVQVKG
jgi:basic membrane lipoprotein Med (substrate-binding protein (PBP1-ABC) superfamily)